MNNTTDNVERLAQGTGYASGPRTTGPIIWQVTWDKRGHWIAGKHGHTNHLWLWAGPTRSQDGLTVFNIVIGPFGMSAGWRGWHNSNL